MTEYQLKQKAYLEQRIEILEQALCDASTVSNVSAGSVAETVDREKLERELDRTRAKYESLCGLGTQVFGVVMH